LTASKSAAIILNRSLESLSKRIALTSFFCLILPKEGFVSLFRVGILATVAAVLSGCASGTYKARQEMREKAAVSTGLFCEFVNGEQHTDVDVELNLQMAKRCDGSKPFSITNYRNSSEMFGVVYCCQTPAGRRAARAEPKVKSAPKASPVPIPSPSAAPADKEEDLGPSIE
jgi:hypothetical protein